MYTNYKNHFKGVLTEIKDSGLWKDERIITTPQSNKISTTKVNNVLNMCANNYLGLSNNKELIEAAKESYDNWGYGLSSVRLYSSCFDANGGLFETITTADDAIISDELNHASIIDGVRLAKAKKYRYKNNNMEDLEAQLIQAEKDGAKLKVIATDGVFSMDGIICNLKGVCDLAEKYNALVMVDDSHAVGFVGKTGRGTHEYNDVMDRVDIITGTLGKALGGASGGYTSGRKEIIDLLRQRSRPYLFSNTLAPAIAAASIKVLDMLSSSTKYRDKVEENTKYFREKIKEIGLETIDSVHPIVPIMLGDAVLSQKMAEKMLEKGVYVVGFYFPVVPKGKARIRTQISAGHSKEDLDLAIKAFKECKEELGI
jgi:glycine C-acetyltransferase